MGNEHVQALYGIYPIHLQKGLDLIIKYLINVYRSSLAMGVY